MVVAFKGCNMGTKGFTGGWANNQKGGSQKGGNPI